MSRQRRVTEQLHTLDGLLTRYDEIEAHLSEGEIRGRLWAFERARDPLAHGKSPSDWDILDLHRAMFADLFDWAGKTRTEDRGPGGNVPVSWPDVRVALRSLADDLRAWVGALDGTDPSLAQVAEIVAEAHHRLQWIHPFHDTNGRTGRVLDHYLLWVTFQLVGSDFSAARALEYFPSSAYEDMYYEGLREADLGRPDKLRAFYLDRLLASFGDAGE